MTPEARVGFVLFFFAAWCFSGLMAWAIVAVVARGRGAFPALPIALGAACAAGVSVPLIGFDDFAGFLLSLVIAFLAGAVGSVAGIGIARRLWPMPAAAQRRWNGRGRDADSETRISRAGPDT
jgi:hypothetical protein